VQGAEHPPFELPNRWTYATLKAIVEDYVEGMTGAPVVVDQLYYKKARGKSVVLLNNDGDLTALLKEYPLLHKCGKKKMKSTMYLAVDYHNQCKCELIVIHFYLHFSSIHYIQSYYISSRQLIKKKSTTLLSLLVDHHE